MRSLNEYNRFFAFGCSFTKYFWPTWADILGQEFNPVNYFNYGVSGAGNYYICQEVIRADLNHNFTKDDLIMIMFSGTNREDRFVPTKDGKSRYWCTPGNLYSQNIYDKGFMKYWDDLHGISRDLMLIRLLRHYLEHRNLDFNLMQMVELGPEYWITIPDDNLTRQIKGLTDLYKEDLSYLKPSIHNLIFEGDWANPKFGRRIGYEVEWMDNYIDTHAHPKEYLLYLQSLWPDMKLKQSTIDYAHNMHDLMFKLEDVRKTPIIRQSQSPSVGWF